MLTLREISKAYGERVLFRNVSIQVGRRDRVGLVGPNGAGKTTLFSLIRREETPDAGELAMERGVTVGHLPQETVPVSDETALELAMAVSLEMAALHRGLNQAEAHADAGHDEGQARARYQELGGPLLQSRARQMLAYLGFRPADINRPARTLSGGWIMRAHLARLLVQQPDLLLLDEPTNHLDLSTLLWFQDYLLTYPGALLVISHDREFLNHLVGSVVDIRHGRLTRYRGNYDEYAAQREAHDASQLAAHKNQQKEIDRLMVFVNRFRAKNTKASQAQSKLKYIARMEKFEAPAPDCREIDFSFPQPARSGLRVVRLCAVDFSYGANPVYTGLNFEAERGQRIVLVGPNGAGKSTLLKLLAGVLTPGRGERQLGHNARSGYYAQHRLEMLQDQRTVLEEALETPQRVTEQFVRTLLGSFLFRDDDVFKPVRVLSGGEKSRLALVKLLLDPPNLLLMDEPTTHLDIASMDTLAAALSEFTGTLIFISHDVHFIRLLANHVVHVDQGRLTAYPGDYQYYLDKTAAVSARAALTAGGAQDGPARSGGPGRSALARDQRRLEAEQRNARSRRRREQEQAVHALEEQIAALEGRQEELVAEMERPETYSQPGAPQKLNRELLEVRERLAAVLAHWETAAEKLQAL